MIQLFFWKRTSVRHPKHSLLVNKSNQNRNIPMLDLCVCQHNFITTSLQDTDVIIQYDRSNNYCCQGLGQCEQLMLRSKVATGSSIYYNRHRTMEMYCCAHVKNTPFVIKKRKFFQFMWQFLAGSLFTLLTLNNKRNAINCQVFM